MGDLFYYNIFYSIIRYTVHKLKSRRIKDAMFMSFKCSINFHRGQNVLIRRPDLNKTDESINAWERIGEITLRNLLHSSWERGPVNLIISPNTGWDVS